MASEVDICNLALARLGDSATVASIDPPEGSAQAEHCARFYPAARDAMLELHNWGFATKRTELALLDVAIDGWAYVYALPSSIVKVIAVNLPGSSSDFRQDESQDFSVEALADGTMVILTNTENASVRYTVKITDTTKFPPLFVVGCSLLLSSYLAGPVIKGAEGRMEGRALLQEFQSWLGQARVSDANQQRHTIDHVVSWIGAR